MKILRKILFYSNFMVDLSEKETREKIIDPILERVGWNVKGSYVKEEINPIKSGVTVKKESELIKGTSKYQTSLVLDNLLNIERLRT